MDELQQLTRAVASAIILAGLLLAVAALLVTRSLPASLPVFTDLLLAGGLLRLAADPGWAMLGTAAVLLVVREAVVSGLRRPAP